jgi:type IV fimbrial biogenesis protein FimT
LWRVADNNKKMRGYTLVEIACVLCIAGIVASFALPSLTALSLDGRRAAAVNDLLWTVRLARSETLKRGGRPLVACGLDDRDGDGRFGPDELACAGYDWSDGWVLGVWDDADANARVDLGELEPLRVFQPPGGGDLSVTAGNFMASPPVAPAGTLLIKPFGKRTSNGTITVCDRRGPAAARAVIVSSLGRARTSATRSDGSALRCP